MLQGLTLILLCDFAGQALSAVLRLPLPGPLVGLLLLLGILVLRGEVPDGVDRAGGGLLRYLGLYFVPAGAGMVTVLGLLAANALTIAVAITVSALLGLAVTGWLMQRLARPDHAE